MAVAALVVSVISLIATTWLGYRQYKAQAVLSSIEQARRTDEVSGQQEAAVRARSAVVTVQWQDNGPALVLHNHGQAVATDVIVELTSAAPGRPPPRLPSGDGKLAVERIEPGESRTVPLTAPYGMATVIRAAVRWHDEAGAHEEAVGLTTVA